MTPEFALIEKFFKRPSQRATLGVGDDCALLAVGAGCDLAVSTDTLVEGTHFFPGANPKWLGHKALAVNLSDLAAMGATPRAVLLALTMPRNDEDWLATFSQGFFALAERFSVELIGGDTTRGPLSMTLTVLGETPTGRAITRGGAKEGDDLWVSGELGAAALALAHLRSGVDLDAEDFNAVEARLHRPEPRLDLGVALRGIATAMIDISDGLVADVGHLGERSQLGVSIDWDQVPMPSALRKQPLSTQHHCALAGGDDYELAFCVPASLRDTMASVASMMRDVPLTRVGVMRAGHGVEVTCSGAPLPLATGGFDHFSATSSPSSL
jgi:thiamine-monophosphate kinase